MYSYAFLRLPFKQNAVNTKDIEITGNDTIYAKLLILNHRQELSVNAKCCTRSGNNGCHFVYTEAGTEHNFCNILEKRRYNEAV